MTGQFPQYSDYVPASSKPQPVHPSLGLGVTLDERDRAERFLADAYADGRLNEFEFDGRMEQVLQAQTRRDLNQAFYGLVDVPPTSKALGLHPAYRPNLVRQDAGSSSGRAAAAIAHFSPFVSWIFGPLLVNLVATPGSFAKREAAKAFNFQFVSTLFFIVAMIANGIVDDRFGWLIGFAWIAWFVLTIVGGVKAAQGENWQNPARKIARWEILKEK
ncbi:DUF1707 and DUF4870 domain-containing protein [Granulicoccus sp. GXG6511]|uniref:DUF1707 and DUF4870 domain-containing protein n=1 Tax=Granulicoccus sp. GXG6511 TaxID=3381351 RepID=UPI003D7DE82A